MSNDSCKVPEVKPITIKRFGTAGLVPTIPTVLDCNLWQKTDLKDGEFAINTVDDRLYIRSGNQIIELTNQSSGGGTGTVTSIATAGLISGGTITSTGTITTSMNTNKLVGRGTAGTGVMEEITLGTNLSLSGTTLNATDQFTGTVTSVGLTMPSAFSVANSPVTSSGTLTVTGAGLANQYVRGDGSLANFPTNGGGGSAVNYYLNGSVNQGTFGGDTYYELSKTPIIGGGTNFTRTNGAGNGYIASFITDAGDPNLLNIPAGNWALEFYFNANSNGGSPSFYGELYKVSNTNVFTLIASGSTNPESITQGTTVDQYFTSIPVPQTTLLATDRLAIRVYVNTGGRNITLHTEDNNLSEVITTFSTGLNALNGLTAQVQNFAVGTSGTDFAINSVTDTHTFNLPTASASNRGALSSGDWSTFNGKVNTGAITGSGLTMATARLLGRSTAGSGAVEEITIGSGLTLSAGTLTAAGGSGITIGTTAIASGTVGRLLFEGTGNVVQQSANLFWDNTNSRLSLGTSSPIASTRLTVFGSGTTSSTFGLQVHNSTGTNNALVVRDDGFIGFGALPYSATQKYRFNVGTDANLSISNPSGTITRIQGVNDANNLGTPLHLNGNPLIFEQATTEYGRLDNTQWRFQNLPFNINQSIGTGGAVSLLNLNNTNNQVATSILNFTIAGGNLAQLRAEATAGDDNVQIRVTNSSGTLIEPIRFQGSGNVLIGTTTDASSRLRVVGSGTGVAATTTFGLQVHDSTGTNNALVVRDDGNVGIGTSSPSQLLTVNGSILTAAGTSVYVGGTTVLGVNGLRLHNNGGSSFIDNKGTGSIFFRSDNTDGSSTRMVLTPSFNLLLGTSTDVASSILTLASTTKGFLPPRMTTAQRDLIGTPAAGLVIYNTTTNKLNLFTTAWEAVTSL